MKRYKIKYRFLDEVEIKELWNPIVADNKEQAAERGELILAGDGIPKESFEIVAAEEI